MSNKSKESLLVQIGETSDGKIVKCDFSSINNMLVSGTTGSGKTSFIYSLLYSLMEQNDPSEVKFMIFSSNVSDYSFLNGSAFMLCPIISDPRRVERAIAVAYEVAARRLEHRELEKAPHVFLIIDDYARATEMGMNLYAPVNYLQLTRLVKMHCILVTSIPTTSVIPSEMRALLPYRVSFTTASPQFSKIILGTGGAESLRYPGEMIYKCGGQTVRLDARGT